MKKLLVFLLIFLSCYQSEIVIEPPVRTTITIFPFPDKEVITEKWPRVFFQVERFHPLSEIFFQERARGSIRDVSQLSYMMIFVRWKFKKIDVLFTFLKITFQNIL